MKLSKIYSNKNEFDEIVFNEGFNVIYGDVEFTRDTSRKVQEHNLGKTSLIYLIDFLLLKGSSSSDLFNKHKEKFSGWIFFLEIELNSGNYLTIRRSVDVNTKISFKEHFTKNQNYTREDEWDYKDKLLNTRIVKDNPKKILQNYLNFDVAEEFDFRSFLPYLLRTQNDYSSVFKMSKHRGKDKFWKPAMFSLLGFNHDLLIEKYDYDDEVAREKNIISKIKKKGDSDEVYKIRAAIEAREIERDVLKKEIDSFDFYKNDKKINFDLVDKIENRISKLNKDSYIFSRKIEQIKKSLDVQKNSPVHLESIKKVFKETKIFFPENLLKNYEEVLNFSQQVTKEREKFLKEELLEIQENQKNADMELKKLNKKRGELLVTLQEKDSFIKYKKYQEELIKLESEILSYKQKHDNAETVENYQKTIDETIHKIKDLSALIKTEADKSNPDFQSIKEIFREIYKETFEYTAVLMVGSNSYGNVDFSSTVLSPSHDLETGKGEGYTSTKVLCASFVLAILIHYSTKSFFRFAYHDGLLESWGDNHKSRFIEIVREYCNKNDIQYIISLIKSDIPDGFVINKKEIVRTLSKGSELFGFKF